MSQPGDNRDMPWRPAVTSRERAALRWEQARRLLDDSRTGDADAGTVEALSQALEELRTAEEELRRQNEELNTTRATLEAQRRRYHDLFELAPDGYLVTDLQGVVREANLAVGRLLGLSPEHLAGKPLVSFVVAEDRRAFRHHLLMLSEAQETRKVEVRLQPRRGAVIYASLTVVASRDDRGQPAGLLWSLRDITARVAAEGEVRRLNAELEQRVAARTAELRTAVERMEEYLQFITHDLRQPLTVVQGMAQLLQKGAEAGNADGRLRMAAHAIYEGSRRLAEMIADLADTVGQDAGRVVLDRQRLSLGEFVLRLVDSAFLGEERSRLQVDVTGSGPLVYADPARLERAVVNLLVNALKYSPPTTPVMVRVTADEGEALVAVADHGEGIPAADLPHLFQRYYRSRATKKVDGLGLGLYISRLIIQSHGGRIWVDSEVGKGSTFYFTLPLAV